MIQTNHCKHWLVWSFHTPYDFGLKKLPYSRPCFLEHKIHSRVNLVMQSAYTRSNFRGGVQLGKPRLNRTSRRMLLQFLRASRASSKVAVSPGYLKSTA